MSELVVQDVSRWFGNVVAVNDVSMHIGPGITGLLGPNGAGKSTLIHMLAGFLQPSAGRVELDGQPTWRNERIYGSLGLVPEREELFDSISGWQFVLANARLHRLADPERAARRAIEVVEMVVEDPQPYRERTEDVEVLERIEQRPLAVEDRHAGLPALDIGAVDVDDLVQIAPRMQRLDSSGSRAR